MANSDTTTEAGFKLLLESDYYWSKTEESSAMRRSYRKRLNDGSLLSVKKMEELLEKAGFTVKQEKLWNLPK